MRRTLLSLVTGGLVVLSACERPSVTGPQSATALPNPMFAMGGGTNVNGDLAHLESIAHGLARLSERLNQVNATFSDPPEPSKPAFRAAVQNIKAQAQEILRVADEIELKVR